MTSRSYAEYIRLFDRLRWQEDIKLVAIMKLLVILVAVTCCSAQLVHYSAPWVPTTKLITKAADETEVKPVALTSPYLHPFNTPYLHPYGLTPYSLPLGHHLPYSYPLGHHIPYITSGATLKATEFPYIYQTVTAEEEVAEEPAAVEEARRRRRDVRVPLPYIHAVPTLKEVTVETKQFEPVDAATPADTTKIELTTKEHEISVPAVKYVQPHVNLKPVTYSTYSPALLHHPGVYSSPFLPYTAAGFTGAFHPIHYSPFATGPVIKIDE